MKAADRLGTGSSFGNVSHGRSARGRAKAVTQGDVPAYELVRLRLNEVAPTPLNPRRNFGTKEELTRFGEELRAAQLAACVAVSRDAYLNLWPDHENEVGDASHILVNGERRYRSAAQVGLDALDFVVRDELATSRETFINHLLKENLDRADFDIIERARGINELVEVCAEESVRGARSRAAESLGKDRSWITHQLSLLELPEAIQQMLSSGDLPERDGRLLVRHLKDHQGLLSAAELLQVLKDEKATRSAEKEAERVLLAEARGRPPNPVEQAQSEAPSPGSARAGATEATGESPLPMPLSSAATASSPVPKTSQHSPTRQADEAADRQAKPAVVPVQSATRHAAVPPLRGVIELVHVEQVADALADHMSGDELKELAELLLERSASM
ncbi:Chromosome-partitioning protein Spo0J [Streptomyces sp. ADI92-24]|uniref:ParB/RepB/Spo0J family partition protein n=1 Tax=Streptomyces sp. ADI92-24 TaxID=1522756 RepID=UPI000F550831|nr:plasmid partitioning protein [Streptomyces sp. ADI92-24]RPK32283.1 Chromosome-partitioning protein Spo0J [Streptomyces sp. ADI92-24]